VFEVFFSNGSRSGSSDLLGVVLVDGETKHTETVTASSLCPIILLS
jgi:hypothetical protein